MQTTSLLQYRKCATYSKFINWWSNSVSHTSNQALLNRFPLSQKTASLLHFPTLPQRPLSKNFGCKKTVAHRHKRPSSCIIALKRDHHEHGKDHYNGRLVDNNMIVLRTRIHEIKMNERKDEEEAPSDWMEWEKRWYLSYYDSDVCEAVGLLQTVLMETRPRLVLGMVALLVVSVPTSCAFVLRYLMDFFH